MLSEVNEFASQFFSKVAIRSFSYGNIDGDRVKPVIDHFFERYSADGLSEKQVEAFENKYLKMHFQNLKRRKH